MAEMKIWKWLYDNPDSDAAHLKEKALEIAAEVWNKYFAPVFGVKDSPVLVIYSHMIDSPLYLPNYSYGQIIEFQIEEYLKGKDFSREIDRMYKQGTLTPQQWMKGAVGEKISVQPVLKALEAALR
jgi:oligoendopeptidase F